MWNKVVYSNDQEYAQKEYEQKRIVCALGNVFFYDNNNHR